MPLEPTTRVVNVKCEPFDVYIGRGVRRARDRRCGKTSVFANPYLIGQHGNRAMVVTLYEGLMRQRLASRQRKLWLGRLRELAGKRLGCWCKPRSCHGDVLVKLIGELQISAGSTGE